MNSIQRARQMHIADIPTRSAQRYTDKIALIDGQTQISYHEFKQTVDCIARQLYQRGLRKNDKLLIFSHNCWQFPTILYAVAQIGVIAVPINYMLNQKEVRYLLEDAQPNMVVVEDALCQTMQQVLNQSSHQCGQKVVLHLNTESNVSDEMRNNFNQLGWQDFEVLLSADAAALPEIALDSADPIRMMYTSGTESMPKGVLLSSDSLMWQYSSCMIEGEMRAQDREIHAFPLYHCAQLDAFLNVDLLLGATSYIFARFDPALILKTIATEKINKLFCPPTAWIALMNHADFDQTDLSSLEKAYYGASTMPKAVIERLMAKLPEIRFWQFYGQTEMSPLAAVLHPEDHVDYADAVGRPALHVETQIMDEDGNILGAGEVGEIVHRSPQLTIGYHLQAEKTQDSFAHGWFHSGDLGYFNAQGLLYVVDRMKDMVKTGGENVSTREVEDVIYLIPAVKEVAVFGLPHEHWVEAVTAAVVLHDGQSLDENSLIAFCQQHLSAYKLPKRLILIDQLPKNASGKILKRELKTTYSTDQSVPTMPA